MLVGGINGQERYLSITEPLLYEDNIFQPGLTYTNKYEAADASAAQVYTPGAGADVSVSNTVGDYSAELATDSLQTIVYNNYFRKQKKFYNAQGMAVPYDMGATQLDIVMKQIQEAEVQAGVGCLVNESTKYSDTNPITLANIQQVTLDMIAEMRNKNANPNTVVCSWGIYNTIQMIAKDVFTGDIKNEMATTGKLVGGKWLGLTWIPTSTFEKTSVKYVDSTGTLKTVNLKGECDMVMYDLDAFSILGKTTDLRIVDQLEGAPAASAQSEIVLGFKVTNPARALRHSLT